MRNNKDYDLDLRSQIALGWVLMLVVLTLTTALLIIQSSLDDNNFHALKVDPGRKSLDFLVFVFAIYVLMPIYVHLVNRLRSSAWRWAAVVMAALILVFFLLHHTAHWVHGDRPTISSHVMDILHHAASIWVLVNSIRWARSRDVQPVAQAT